MLFRSIIARIVRAPGLGLQYLTTREPDLKMLEVALAAFHLAMDPTTAKAAAETAPESSEASAAAADTVSEPKP